MRDSQVLPSLAIGLSIIAMLTAIATNLQAKRLIDERLPVKESCDCRHFPVTNSGDSKIFIYFDDKEYGPFIIQPGMTRVFTFDSQCPETGTK